MYFTNILKINPPNQHFLTLFGPQVEIERFQFLNPGTLPFCLCFYISLIFTFQQIQNEG